MEVRPLRPEDDRTRFSSGDVELDRFFQRYAGQNQFKHHIGTTYIAVDDTTIWGYATVSMAHLEVADLPREMTKGWPRYPLPVLRLARLAVARPAQGQGIGGALLYSVFQLALSQAASVGCIGVLVDAKPQAIAWYTRYGFTALDVLEGGSAARPRPTAMFLPLRTIQAAAAGPNLKEDP
jgi:GNAT superfamily N-acetyltransferase